MTGFTDKLAWCTIMFIFVVHCGDLFFHSSFIQALWKKARKIKFLMDSQTIVKKWSTYLNSKSPHAKSPTSKIWDKNETKKKDIESQSPSNKTLARNKKLQTSPHLKQRKTPKMRRTEIKYVGKQPVTFNFAVPKTGKQKPALNMESANTYDLFKLFSTAAMFLDHYGYMGLPLRTQLYTIPNQHWLRIYGRAAAPGFFFLAGYSSKRFRMQVWVASVFLYWSTVYFFLDIVFVPFESILCVALINCIYKYLPPHKVLSHWFVSMVALYLLHQRSQYFSKELHIAYGTLPFAFAIAGDMVKHKKRLLSLIWCVGSCASFATYSINSFSRSPQESNWIIAGAVLNCLFMVFFKVKEAQFLNQLPEPLLTIVRDGIKWLSRNGLVVYIGHLMLYRLTRQTYRLPPSIRY